MGVAFLGAFAVRRLRLRAADSSVSPPSLVTPGGFACSDLPHILEQLLGEASSDPVGERERAQMRFHLAACPECHATTQLLHGGDPPWCAQLAGLPAALAAHADPEPPVEAQARVTHAETCPTCVSWLGSILRGFEPPPPCACGAEHN